MSSLLRAIEVEAMKLSPEERAELAERLIASVEPPVPLDAEWKAEIARRLDDLDNGRTQSADGEQVLAELRKLIGSHRDAV
ncbi:MAG TPA: addiction module protein [Burkholderiaceae bacterium]|jgi:putative addiction module component (TIGR02574 family)|nr:addiction module protein [Burkholderiaceae bacterium]